MNNGADAWSLFIVHYKLDDRGLQKYEIQDV